MKENFNIIELKKEYHEYCLLHNRHKQEKNQKIRDKIERELNWKKDKMIKIFDLKEVDMYINAYKYDDDQFRINVSQILSYLED